MTIALSAIIEAVQGHSAFAAAGLLACTSFAAAVVVFLRSGNPRTLRGLRAFLLPADILTHRSAKADFLFWVTHKLLMWPVGLYASVTASAAVGYATHSALIALVGPTTPPSGHPGPWLLAGFTLCMLVAYDFSYYAYHTLQHRLPILWELHKVHHSAEVMVGTTKDRVHPFDEILNKLWDGLITGPFYGLWLFLIPSPVELTVLGVNIYVLRNIIMMDFVRHTHLKVSFGPLLNQVVLCPHYHQLHHSVDPKHWDRNFGLMLPVWDRLFGTLVKPEPGESFTFGLPGSEAHDYQSMYGLYVLPLRRMIGCLRRPRFIGRLRV